MIRKLVIGPGPGWKDQKQRDFENGKESVSIDIICEFEPDYCVDIENGLPKELEGFDEVEAHHIFEHIGSNNVFRSLMWDIWFALKPGGTVDICVPYWKDDSAVECFEHVRFFNENSFMNFYNNPYIDEMKLPPFELVVNEVRTHGNGSKEVHVCMRKILQNQ
jgi:hypothetical protein